jgi:hypothetical protein
MRIVLAIPVAPEEGGALVVLPTVAGFCSRFTWPWPSRSREIFRGVR